MRRTVRTPAEARLKPVEKIEVSGKRIVWRLLAVILFLAIAAASFSYGIMQLVSPGEKGWTEIKASTSSMNCAEDFVFLYEIGNSGQSASAEQKALTRYYTDITAKAWQLFNNEETAEGVPNVRYLNDHPGEIVEIDEGLYKAFETVEASGNRALYLGPVAEIYDNLFACQDDRLTADFDPLLNDDVRGFFAQAAAFARDPKAVSVELLGDNRVCLSVSADYLTFAAEEEINDFIDFHWMLNAFVIDYLADRLIDQGFSFGTLSSYDGFARALDGREDRGYAYNLYDRGNLMGVMRYSGVRSIMALRGYPLSSMDGGRFYVRQDGQIRTAYLDTADGLSRAAAADLVAYATDVGCAEMLLRIAPIYIADDLDLTALTALTQDGIQSIISENGAIRYTDSELALSDLAEGYGSDLIQ